MHLGYGGENMFVVVVYDVHKSRCTKVMKYLRKWLEHRQRSVFSGFLTESQVKIMHKGLIQLIVANYDSVIIFQSNRANQITEFTTSGADRMRYSSMIGGKNEKEEKYESGYSVHRKKKRADLRGRFRFSTK